MGLNANLKSNFINITEYNILYKSIAYGVGALKLQNLSGNLLYWDMIRFITKPSLDLNDLNLVNNGYYYYYLY